jgi:dihydroflavonol-4-reductase
MILVTGAAGHIGNVLVRELVDRGERVRALILPGEDTASLYGLDIEIIVGNVLDPESLDRATRGVDIVYHLAGLISILPDKNDLMWQVNVEGTRNILAAAKNAGVRRLVHTASIHALSRNWIGKINEEVPFDPDATAGGYDRTKAAASLLVLEAVKDGLDAVIVCPTGVIGPHDYRGSEMGDLIKDWLRKKLNFLVKGAYDFVDVRDVVQGQILACERGRSGEVYILSGWQIKVLELKQLVQNVIGKRISTITLPMWLAKFGAKFMPFYYKITRRRPRFTDYSLETLQSNSDVSSDKAQTELGYKPRELKITIKDTVDWLLRHVGKVRR